MLIVAMICTVVVLSCVSALSSTFQGNLTATDRVQGIIGDFQNVSIGFMPWTVYEFEDTLIFTNGSEEGVFKIMGTLNITENARVDGNLTIGDPFKIYEENGDLYMYNETGQGRLFIYDLVVTNNDSIQIGGVGVASISVSNVTVGGRSRIGIRVDRDLGVLSSFNGSVILGAINLNIEPYSNALTTNINGLGNGLALIKLGPNYMNPQVGFLTNNAGELAINNRNDGGYNITISYYDGVIRDTLQSFRGFENITTVINIENKNAADQFKTTFNYNVSFKQAASFDNGLFVTGNLTIGDKITFRNGEFIDNLADGWIRVNGSLNVTEDMNVEGNTKINGNLNVEGNITGNSIYGGLTGYHIGDVPISASGVYFNVTNVSQQLSNGFAFNLSGEGELTVQIPGVYELLSGWSFANSANTEYHIAVGINWVRDMDCHGEAKLLIGGDVGNAATSPCTKRLEVGDKVNLMLENVDNANDPTIHSIGLTVKWVGN